MRDDKVRAEIDRSRQLLRTLRDDLRVRLHLAGMDARQAFVAIERDAKRFGADFTQATQAALKDANARLQKLADRFAPGKTRPQAP
jgi:hypothetical protein